MAQTVYFIKASWLKAWDWCPRKVHLEAKYGLKEKPGLQLAKWIIWHDFFCNYKESELTLLSQEQNLSEREIKEQLIQSTAKTLDDVISYNKNKITEFVANEQTPAEFIADEKNSLQSHLEKIAGERAPKLEKINGLRFLREENPYSPKNIATYRFLKNNNEGIGGRPDFVLFIKSGDCYRATILDVKPKLSDNKGDILQNVAGYLAVEANLSSLMKKAGIDKRTIMAANHWVFEYVTGNENSYSIKPDIPLLLERAKALRVGNFPREQYLSWKCEKCGIAQQCADSKYS